MAGEAHDLGGRLVLPGLVDGHIHLDKGFVGDKWKPHRPCTAGFSVRERVTFEKEMLADAQPIPIRAAALIDLCVAHGTTQMRSHVDIDLQVGLRNLEQVMAARDAHRGKVSVQIVAFPQSGIVTSPGVAAELLDEAVRAGAESGRRSRSRRLRWRHRRASRRHLRHRRPAGCRHRHSPARWRPAWRLRDREHRAQYQSTGLGGKVTISHAYALGEVSETSSCAPPTCSPRPALAS